MMKMVMLGKVMLPVVVVKMAAKLVISAGGDTDGCNHGNVG